MNKQLSKLREQESGFSLIELFAVLIIIGIVSAIAIFYLTGHQKLYKPDDQSLLITDILQEARQRSLTQRETMRVEINLDRNTVNLIDENTPTTADDDRQLRNLKMFDPSEVSVGALPGNITDLPPESLPAPVAVFRSSVYPTSISQNVCTLRFLSNGTVVDAGNNPVGTGAASVGTTLPIWSRNKAVTGNSDIARAITVIGATGTIRLWEYDASLTTTNKWKDSRRYGTYGGSTGNANVP